MARRDNLNVIDFFSARLSGFKCRFHFHLPSEASPVWQKTGPRLNCTVGRADARGVGAINTGDKFHADPRVWTVREAGGRGPDRISRGASPRHAIPPPNPRIAIPTTDILSRA